MESMMKKIGALCFLFASVLSFADEPSVQAECESGYREYLHDGTKLQLCPNLGVMTVPYKWLEQ